MLIIYRRFLEVRINQRKKCNVYKLTSDNVFLARIFLFLGGSKNIFYSVAGSQFVATGSAKILKISQKLMFLFPKWILDRDFALSGEIINDNKFLFYAIFFS